MKNLEPDLSSSNLLNLTTYCQLNHSVKCKIMQAQILESKLLTDLSEVEQQIVAGGFDGYYGDGDGYGYGSYGGFVSYGGYESFMGYGGYRYW